MKLNRKQLDSLHDIIVETKWVVESITDQQIYEYWNKLPLQLHQDFFYWGECDTVVRDNIYVWIVENIK